MKKTNHTHRKTKMLSETTGGNRHIRPVNNFGAVLPAPMGGDGGGFFG